MDAASMESTPISSIKVCSLIADTSIVSSFAMIADTLAKQFDDRGDEVVCGRTFFDPCW
jgi:hypothetical protein